MHAFHVVAHGPIHRVTVADGGQVDDEAADVIHPRAALVQQLPDILHHLMGLVLDRTSKELTGGRIDGNLAGTDDLVPESYGLAIGPYSGRGLISVDGFAVL